MSKISEMEWRYQDLREHWRNVEHEHGREALVNKYQDMLFSAHHPLDVKSLRDHLEAVGETEPAFE